MPLEPLHRIKQVATLHREGACVSTISAKLQMHHEIVIKRLKKLNKRPRKKPLQDRADWAFARAGNPKYD